MASYNKTTIVGNLSRDPEVRYTQKGTAIASFALAVNRKWKDESGETKEEVSFIDCTAFGRTAENIGQYTKKGHSLMVDGRLKQETWDDKNGGGKRSKLVVIVEAMVLLQNRKADSEERQDQPPKSQAAPSAQESDEIPF